MNFPLFKSVFISVTAIFFLLEDAHSFSRFSTRVEWESDSKNFIVQVKDPSLKKTKYKVSETHFEIPILVPGQYEWRVKSDIPDQKGHYSEWVVLNVKDGLSSFEKPLMISPPNGFELDKSESSSEVELKYERPSSNWNYKIEILEDGVLKEETNLVDDSFNYKMPDSARLIKWRVRAVNRLGYKTKNEDYWSLVRPNSASQVNKLFYAFGISRLELKQKFTIATSGEGVYSDTFILQKHGMRYRYFPNKKIFHSFEAGLFYLMPLQFSDDFKAFQFDARLKANIGSSKKHRILAEFESTQITYRLDDEFNAGQQLNFFLLGLESELVFLNPNLVGSVLLKKALQSSESLPGYKARLDYKFSDKFVINFLYDYSSTSPAFEVNGVSSTSESTIQQIEFGFTYLLI